MILALFLSLIICLPVFTMEKSKEQLNQELLAIGDDEQGIINLLWAGANIECTNEKGFTPLHDAASRGKLVKVITLLQCQADPNSRSILGWAPLHSACGGVKKQKGHLSIIQTLLHHDADINSKTSDNRFTPLLVAALWGNLTIVEVLLKHGARIHCKSAKGATAIDKARCSRNEVMVTIIQTESEWRAKQKISLMNNRLLTYLENNPALEDSIVDFACKHRDKLDTVILDSQSPNNII